MVESSRRARRQGHQCRRRGGIQGQCPHLLARRRSPGLRRDVAADRDGAAAAPSTSSASRIRCTSIATISAFPAMPTRRSPPSRRPSGRAAAFRPHAVLWLRHGGARAASPRRRRALAEEVNRRKDVTVDVGQVMFGQTVTVSSDTLRQFTRQEFRAAAEMGDRRKRWQRRRHRSATATAAATSTTSCNGRWAWSCFS